MTQSNIWLKRIMFMYVWFSLNRTCHTFLPLEMALKYFEVYIYIYILLLFFRKDISQWSPPSSQTVQILGKNSLENMSFCLWTFPKIFLLAVLKCSHLFYSDTTKRRKTWVVFIVFYLVLNFFLKVKYMFCPSSSRNRQKWEAWKEKDAWSSSPPCSRASSFTWGRWNNTIILQS